MSVATASLAILRAAPVHGQPVAVGAERTAAVAQGAATPTRARDDAFEQGYAAGLEKGIATGFEQGHAEGLRTGQAKGFEEASERVRAAIEEARARVEADAAAGQERIAQAIATVSEARRQVALHAERELIALGFELACKVLGPAMASAEGIRSQVRLLLGDAREGVTVHVHPAMAAELSQQPASGVRWVADDAVCMGGVRLHDGAMTIDATLDTILANFRDVMLLSLDDADAACVEGAGT
jgi:flagellar assembly protein FliH